MPYIKPTNRKFCLNSDIADVLLMKQEQYPCEPYDEPYYNPIDKKFQMKEEILKNFWLGCENVKGCADKMRSPSAPYEVWLGIDKYYLENIFKYPVTPNDLPYNEPQFAYTKTQWVQYKDIFGVNYHFTINGKLSDNWETHYYKQTNKAALPTPNTLNKNFVVTSFKERKRATYTDNYDTAKANQPNGCDHYDRYTDESKLIAHHGIPPLRLMYKVGTTWVQDSFTSSETPFIATATPANYIIPSSANSTTYDTDITFSLPEYSGLTEVNYVWNIRQIESGLTLKANIKQKKKTGTASFSNGTTIKLEGIGSEGRKGVKPTKGIIYTGDYNDGVNDTISWMNKTNGYSPATGNFTDETHADSTGLDDNIRITSNKTWCHDIKYNLTGWEAFVDWWKDGEGQGSRTATITMAKYDPRLDIVTPYKFDIVQAAPVVEWCYYFSGLSAGNLSCHGGTVSASVATSIKKKYHDYSECTDGFEDYLVSTENVGWDFSPKTIGENKTCRNVSHTITATQKESGKKLTTTITQSYDCDSDNYINNCRVTPSSVGAGGGKVTVSANARYYQKTCSVDYDISTYSPTEITIPANTDQSSKTHTYTITNAGGATCTVSVTQAGAPAPAGCSPNSGHTFSASIDKTSVPCSGGSVNVNVSASKKDGDGGGDVAWSVSPGGGSGTGSGSATVNIGSTTSDKTTTITVSGAAGSCDFNVSQTGCSPTPPDPTGSTCTISVSPSSGNAPCTGSIPTHSINVNSTGNWTASTTGCSVNKTSGTSGNTPVTVTVNAGQDTAKVTFKCDDSSATYTINRSGNGCSGGGGGDCSCKTCEIFWHTDMNINSLDWQARTATFFVYHSCYDCKPVSWKVWGDPPLTFSKTTGGGICCPQWDCKLSYDQDKPICIQNTTDDNKFVINIPANETGKERTLNIYIEQTGQGCSAKQNNYIKQSAKPSECPDGKYVAFANSRTETMDANGGTLDEVIKRYCTNVTSFTTQINGGDTTNNVTFSPSSGAIDKTKITVGANNSTLDRTIVITIHPNIDEKVP